MSEQHEALRPECGHAFQDIAVKLGALDSIGKDLADVKEAVLGNGEPTKGLAARVERLESANKNTWKVVGVCVAIAAALVAVISLVR